MSLIEALWLFREAITSVSTTHSLEIYRKSRDPRLPKIRLINRRDEDMLDVRYLQAVVRFRLSSPGAMRYLNVETWGACSEASKQTHGSDFRESWLA